MDEIAKKNIHLVQICRKKDVKIRIYPENV